MSIARSGCVRRTSLRLGLASLLLCSLPSLAAAAPTVPVRFLDVEDGLSHSVVYALLRDRDGFVWIGTEDGLDRYDGYRFTHVHHVGAQQGGTHWDTSDLAQDRDGVIWIATWGGGVKSFDPRTGTVRVFRHDPQDPHSLIDDRAQDLHLDRLGRLWIGTYRGLERLAGTGADGRTRFVHYPRRAGLAPRVWSILDGAGGEELWVGTDEGLELVDPARVADPDAPDAGEGRRLVFLHDPRDPGGLVHPLVRTLWLDDAGRLWVGTDAGFQVMADPGPGASFEDVPLPDDTINTLMPAGDGTLWVGTHDAGLLRLDPASREVLEHLPFGRDALRHADVRSLLRDPQGLVWVGTRGGGVQLLDRGPRPVRPVDLGVAPDELDNPRELLVTAVLVDAGGRLWAGTDRGLVRVTDGGGGPRVRRFRHHPDDPSSLVRDNVSTLHQAKDGTLWVGAFGGLAKYRPATADGPEGFVRTPLRVPAHGNAGSADAAGDPLAERVEALADAPGGDLWIGTRAGLARLAAATGELRFLAHDPADATSLADDYIHDLEPSPDGTLWIGTDAGGLDHYQPATGIFRHYRHDPGDPASLSHDRIFDVYLDPAGIVWLATAYGLNRLDPATGAARRLGTDDGLPSATLKCLAPAPDAPAPDGSALWLSSNGGITRLALPLSGPGPPPANPVAVSAPRLRNYGHGDGLGGLLFVEGSCAVAAATAEAGPFAGHLFFGGHHGLEQVDPTPTTAADTDVPLVLTGTEVGGHVAAAGEGLRLAFDHRSFGFEFAALDYRAPSAVRYAYRLEGFDDGWTESSRRYASYTNVPPGDYVFRVRATGSRGRPLAQTLAVPVSVAPPFWQTLWFRLGALAVVVALLTAGHKLRTRHLKAQKRLLEEQVREQTAVLRRQRRRLEMIDRIVRLINEESDFEEVLHSILEGIGFTQAADRALALVRRRPPDGPHADTPPRFEIASHFGWPAGPPIVAPMLVSDIEGDGDAYLATAVPQADGIWIGPPAASPLRAAEEKLGAAPHRVLGLRVSLDGETAGYLLFSKFSDERVFVDADPGELASLKDHVESAFRKAAMLDQLRWLDTKKSEFLGIAAHDLRSPLGSIQSYADLLLRWLEQKRFDDERWPRFLGHVRSAAGHMLALLNDLLDVTAIETGRLVLSPVPLELAEVLEERFHLHERLAHDKNIELRLDVSHARGQKVLADRVHTAEVVDNLLSNALKFTRPGGSVTLRCERDDGHDRLLTHVDDTGQGLVAAELEQVFSGRRLSARPTGGEVSTGLGLVIVKKIVEMQGGEVWAVSRQGEGSTFSFSLPRTNDP